MSTSSSSSSIDSSSSSSIDSSSSSSSSSIDSSSSSSSIDSSSSSSIDSSSSSWQYSSSSSSSSSSSFGYSTSSSSSSSSFGYSSTSSDDVESRQLNQCIINEGHHNLLPFTFIAERGYVENLDESVLNFTIASSSSPNLDYEAVLKRDNSNIATNLSTDSDVFVPEDENSYYEHRSDLYVDVISKDDSGIKKVRTHTEPNAYQFDDVNGNEVFYIPKLTWVDNSITTTSNLDDTFWAGTNANKLFNQSYNRESITSLYEEDLGSPVNKIVLGDSNNNVYVSTNDSLILYYVDRYSNEKDIQKINTVSNDAKGYIDLHKNGIAWDVQSYEGKVVKLDESTLLVTREYLDFDAPFKIRWSEYHQAYIVAGSYMLWMIDDTDNTVTTIYQVNDYRIVDFDVSEDGKICIVMNGEKDIIRVLDNDFYTFSLNEFVSDYTLRFCKYCKEGRFYILGEIYTGTSVYTSIHYVFNSNSNILQKVDSEEALFTTTTTTTLGTTSKAVEVIYPNDGEQLQIGEEHEIKWISNKAVSDLVKIELYRLGEFNSVIVNETPNTGIYKWIISSNVKDRENYKIKVTWLSASSDANNYDFSNDFEIVTLIIPTTTTTTTIPPISSVGIDYDLNNDQIVILLNSGLYALYDLSTSILYGLIESGVIEPITITTQNSKVGNSDKQEKVRIFVGSQKYWSDKWDSGDINTELTSMYYGGGQNLISGQRYYVHIRTWSAEYGWGELQVKDFIIPKK